MTDDMQLSDFDFHLPESSIAQHPVEPRDSARLLVVKDDFSDSTIRDLPNFLSPGDLIIFNNTKVIPARLFGKRGDAKVEILLLKSLSQGEWECFAKPAKRLQINDIIVFPDDFLARVRAKHDDGTVVIAFPEDDAAFYAKLERYGHMPLPPYIKREDDKADQTRYQTVYAKNPGAVAAPTAGLHFTDALFEKLKTKGIQTAYVTLHVGAGTFQPVKVDNIAEHTMHSEYCTLTADVAATINSTKNAGKRVIAVGTTSLRVLESATDDSGVTQAFEGDTAIFITPGYRFKCVDLLVTNFHLPKSTLFMLVSAFCGLPKMKDAYQYAVDQGYRFYSYGDASLLYKSDL